MSGPDQDLWRIDNGALPGCAVGTVISFATEGQTVRVMRPGVGQVLTLHSTTTSQSSSDDGSTITLVNTAEGWQATLSRVPASLPPAPFAYCTRCGANLIPGAQFCASCGLRVGGEVAQANELIATPGASPAIPAGAQPAVIVSTPGGPRRIWLVLGAVIFVAIVAAAAVVALAGSGGLTPHHTIAGTFDLIATDQTFPSITSTGATCQGTGGYSDIQPGAPVTLKDGDGKILGSTSLLSGTGTTSSCTFSFSIPDVPEVPFYSMEIGRRGAVTNSLAVMQANGWTFGLTLGK